MKKRRPHNAKVSNFESFEQLLAAAANAPRKVTVNGKLVKMSRKEVLYRTIVNRALDGGIREVAFIIKAMVQDSALGSTCRRERVLVFNGYWAKM
jgi:hypothetical protein